MCELTHHTRILFVFVVCSFGSRVCLGGVPRVSRQGLQEHAPSQDGRLRLQGLLPDHFSQNARTLWHLTRGLYHGRVWQFWVRLCLFFKERREKGQRKERREKKRAGREKKKKKKKRVDAHRTLVVIWSSCQTPRVASFSSTPIIANT